MSKGMEIAEEFDSEAPNQLAAAIDAALAEREHEPANYETCRCAGCDWWRGRVAEERARGIEEEAARIEADVARASIGATIGSIWTRATWKHLAEDLRARAARIREGKP